MLNECSSLSFQSQSLRGLSTQTRANDTEFKSFLSTCAAIVWQPKAVIDTIILWAAIKASHISHTQANQKQSHAFVILTDCRLFGILSCLSFPACLWSLYSCFTLGLCLWCYFASVCCRFMSLCSHSIALFVSVCCQFVSPGHCLLTFQREVFALTSELRALDPGGSRACARSDWAVIHLKWQSLHSRFTTTSFIQLCGHLGLHKMGSIN